MLYIRMKIECDRCGDTHEGWADLDAPRWTPAGWEEHEVADRHIHLCPRHQKSRAGSSPPERRVD